MNGLSELGDVWLPASVMLVLVIASGFFSASETALFSLTRDELRRFRVGNLRQRTVAGLLLDPDRLLTGILFWNLVINLAYFAVSLVVARRVAETSGSTAATLFGLITLATIIVFGEVLPKSLAVAFRRSLSTLVSLPLASSLSLLDPAFPTFRQLTRFFRLLFWSNIKREPFLETEDLERAVEASHHEEDVLRQERQILHNILDLSEITVEEAMRPRGTYATYSSPVHLADLRGEVPASDYVSIRDGNTDNIGSVVPLTSFSVIPEQHLETAAEDVVNVPWCANLAYTLQQLRDRLCSVAAVVNEYGETIGIITYEDILDTVLQLEPSRARRVLKREPILQVAPGIYHVEGMTTIRYLSKRLDLEYTPALDDLVTVAGMLHEELEHIPEVGDECNWQGFRLKVIEVSGRGQLRALLSREGVENVP